MRLLNSNLRLSIVIDIFHGHYSAPVTAVRHILLTAHRATTFIPFHLGCSNFPLLRLFFLLLESLNLASILLDFSEARHTRSSLSPLIVGSTRARVRVILYNNWSGSLMNWVTSVVDVIEVSHSWLRLMIVLLVALVV